MILTGEFTIEQLVALAPHRTHELEIIKHSYDIGPGVELLTIECVECKKMLIDLPDAAKTGE